MNARAYLAELLGTFLFFAIGMSSIQAVGALGAGAAPLLVVVPLGFGLGLLAAIVDVRAHLGRSLQPGRVDRHGDRRAACRPRTPSAISSARSSAPSARPRSS